MSKAVFITGTGTDVGKTYITGLIVKKLQQAGKHPAYYKAAMSGNARRADGTLIPGDALFVQQLSGIPQPLGEMCPYVYEHAWSPHLASRVEGHPVDMAVVRQGYLEVAAKYDYITMEGSGGIRCPLYIVIEPRQQLWVNVYVLCVVTYRRQHRQAGHLTTHRDIVLFHRVARVVVIEDDALHRKRMRLHVLDREDDAVDRAEAGVGDEDAGELKLPKHVFELDTTLIDAERAADARCDAAVGGC